MMENQKHKIGVFFCRCQGEIGNFLDLDTLKTSVEPLSTAVSIHDALCSSDGGKHIKNTIASNNLDRVVIASCSPTHFETNFRNVCQQAGINPGLVSFANIREQAGWVHSDNPAEATKKAFYLVASKIASIESAFPMDLKTLKTKKSVTVIGGGVAGCRITSRLVDLEDYEVHLVERDPFLGGLQIRLSKAFPRDECSYCALTPMVSQVLTSDHVKLHNFSELVEVKGHVGDYTITVRERPRFVDPNTCIHCGRCMEVCPKEVPNEFNFDLGVRKTIFMPKFGLEPQTCFINPEHIDFCRNECAQPCLAVCPTHAINFDDIPKEHTFKTGVVVTAIGADNYQPFGGEFGYGNSPDVLTLPEYERVLAADGVFSGDVRKISDGTAPKTLAFVLCIGSRTKDNPYCSVYCCLGTASAVRQTHHKLPNTKIYVFYRDLFAPGKFGDDYLKTTQSLPNTEWIRNIPEYYEKDGTKYLAVRVAGGTLDVPVDMIVLATGMVATKESDEIRAILGLERTQEGFFREQDIMLNPVSTHDSGKYVAGTCLGPKTMNQAVTEADSVVSSVLSILGKGKTKVPVFISEVNAELCGACGICVKTCLFHAASIDLEKGISVVDEALCRGCGNCVAACPTGARDLLYYNDPYFLTQIDVLSKYQPPNGGKKVLGIMCKSCGYEAADNIGLSGNNYPTGLMIVRAPCTGRIDTQHIFEALSKGFDGVFIGGCHEGSCGYIGGNYDLERRVDLLKPLMAAKGINPDRVKVTWISPMEITRFNSEIHEFFGRLEGLK